MAHRRIDIIATAISGSVKDWGKVKRILPEFERHGFSQEEVRLHEVYSHADARMLTRRLLLEGSQAIIAAGGSGTFNSALEGCHDAGVDLNTIRLFAKGLCGSARESAWDAG